jgi:hypothetical protein
MVEVSEITEAASLGGALLMAAGLLCWLTSVSSSQINVAGRGLRKREGVTSLALLQKAILRKPRISN